MARDIDRKLRLTAAFLGVGGRKELAAAFHRVNARTSFEVTRADKWLQGRAKPREPQIYEDWAKVVDIDRPGQWIAECDAEAFLDEICARHGRDRETLQRELGSASKRPEVSSAIDLVGTFACYSHAWSIHRGGLLRGEMSIRAASGLNRLRGTYTEILPRDSRVQYAGPIVVGKRAMYFDARDPSGDSQFKFSLFLSSPPASVLGGLWSGTTVLGPIAQPSVTRVVMVRLPAASARLRTAPGFIPLGASLAEDLATLGVHVANPATVDRHLREFLTGGSGGGVDQIPTAAYHALVELFDQSWWARMAPGGEQASGRANPDSARPNDVGPPTRPQKSQRHD